MIDIQDHLKDSKDLAESELAAAKITAQELIEIYYDYLSSLKKLEIEGTYLSNRLQFFKDINSVRWRTKDPIHLLTKIVRKRKEAIEKEDNKSKYLSINVNNYKEVITDLIGLRAIYLFKFQWELVDNYICSNFKIDPEEKITIYHAPEDDLSFYYKDGYEKNIGEIKLKYSQVKKESKYRSTHYIVETNFPNNFKLEIQIRSILDEAWGEIDHYIRYPNHQDDEDLKRKMTVLNGAINGCEELSTSYIGAFRQKNLQVVEEILSEELVSIEGSKDDKKIIKENEPEDSLVETSQEILSKLAFESDLSRLTASSSILPKCNDWAAHPATATSSIINERAARLAAASTIWPNVNDWAAHPATASSIINERTARLATAFINERAARLAASSTIWPNVNDWAAHPATSSIINERAARLAAASANKPIFIDKAASLVDEKLTEETEDILKETEEGNQKS